MARLGFEGLKILGQGRRLDRNEHKEVVLLQRVDNGALGQFHSNGDGTAEALAQRVRPLIDGRHSVGNAIEFARLVTRGLQANVMLGIRPIDADICGELMSGWRLHVVAPKVIN